MRGTAFACRIQRGSMELVPAGDGRAQVGLGFEERADGPKRVGPWKTRRLRREA